MIKNTIPQKTLAQNMITIILHPHFTKLSSVFIGYMLWFFVSQYQWTTIQHNVPLCFYKSDELSSCIISAPDNVTIKISGPRKDIYQLDPLQSAVHIDASSFDDGNHEIQLSRENLFLPDSVKLVQLIPSHISIQISGKDRNHE